MRTLIARETRPRWALVSAAVAVATVAAGCGVLDGGEGALDDLSETEKSRIAEEYRDCMAEGGLDAVVSFDNGIDIQISGGDISEEVALAIEAECEPILATLDAGPELTPEEEAEYADALLEVQKCVAEEGYVITVTGDGIDLNDADQPDDFDEAAYLEVEDACFREAAPDLYEKFGPEGE